MTLNGVTVTLINGRVEGRVLIGWPVPGRAPGRVAESGGSGAGAGSRGGGPVRCGKSGEGSGAVRKVGERTLPLVLVLSVGCF